MRWSVTHGSASANPGSFEITGVSQSTVPIPTSWATTVAPTDFDTDASWNTVSASTVALLPNSRTPNPFAYTVLPPCTTATAMPGTPELAMRSFARPSSFPTASSICPSGIGTPASRPGLASLTTGPGAEVVSESDEHPASRATVSTTGTAAADSRELFLLVMDTRFSLAGLSSVPLGQSSIGERRADIGTNRETL